ncbi:hypothetical protein LTR33_003182 [Friedmanniomyces endolithicus]|nr:hypothetical protein LTR33_003182 [Friedmanniomyces endolithicus]
MARDYGMTIAVTGSSGTVGKEVVKLCAEKGHSVVQIDLVKPAKNDTPNSEVRIANVADDYHAFLKALEGCDALIHLAAIPNPVNKLDADIHNNNVNAAFDGFRAAGELGIKRIAYASSVNAIGLSYSNQPRAWDYFPLDENVEQRLTDSYALAKAETEVQARSFVRWFPGTKIACLRIHEVAPRKEVTDEHAGDWVGSAIGQLWGWVHPVATARACLAAIEHADNFEGCEIFNVHAPNTAQETPSRDLAKKYFPNAKIDDDWGRGNESFWVTEKIERVLGWKHYELE